MNGFLHYAQIILHHETSWDHAWWNLQVVNNEHLRGSHLLPSRLWNTVVGFPHRCSEVVRHHGPASSEVAYVPLIPTRTTNWLLFCLSVTIYSSHSVSLFLQCIDMLPCVVKSSQFVLSLVAGHSSLKSHRNLLPTLPPKKKTKNKKKTCR